MTATQTTRTVWNNGEVRTDTAAESEGGKKTQSRDDGGVELEGVAWGPRRSSGREGTERDSEMERSGGTGGGGGEQGGCKSTFALSPQPKASLFSATCSTSSSPFLVFMLVSFPFWCSVEG